jgi:hypothetical protein
MDERKAERTENISGISNKTLQDISKSGAALNIDRELKNGSVIKVKFQSKNHSLTLRAKVVRSNITVNNLYRTGIHFVYLTDEVKEVIEKIVEEYSKGVPMEASIEED